MGIPLAVDLDSPSLQRMVDHIDHAVDVMGIDHVGIGTDFMTQIVESGAEPAFQATSLMPAGMSFADPVPGFSGPADFPTLVEELEARGYVGDALAAILGGNLLRVIERALPTNDPARRLSR